MYFRQLIRLSEEFFQKIYYFKYKCNDQHISHNQIFDVFKDSVRGAFGIDEKRYAVWRLLLWNSEISHETNV